MKFSVMIPQGWKMDLAGIKDPYSQYETMSAFTKLAEKLGYECAYLFDHFHTVPTPTQESTFECWTTTAALARDTKKIKLGQMVTCNNYRHPALLAKMASTVDAISNGRLIFGIGAGWYEQEYTAYGYTFSQAPIRLKQLHEAVQIILAMWTQDEATFTGTQYGISHAINRPKGIQNPHIPLLIGGGGEKVTLKLVAQYADAGNLGFVDIQTLRRKLQILREHCRSVGREYDGIHKTVLLNCSIDKNAQKAILRAKKIPTSSAMPAESKTSIPAVL
jgi:F420-dependent oxidoreductase-like protein